MGVDPWSLEGVTMDAGFASVWSFHESIEDLKHKLLCATLELEALRSNAKEEMRKSEESIDQLVQLLKVITHERDVARDQLKLLVNRIANSSNGGEFSRLVPCLQQPESPQMRQARGSCSVTTDSDSFSGTPPQHSYGGSPVDSLFENAGSPEFSSLKMNIQQQQQHRHQQQQGLATTPQSTPKYDRASAIIDSLVAKKQLPAKGKLLQAVLEAGPTLQTLLLAGPLPQWRNPPPLQPFQVPPVAVKVHNPPLLNQQITMNPNNSAHASSPNVFAHDKPNGATHFLTQQPQPTVLNLPSATAIKRPMISISPCMKGYDNLHAKRQRTQCTGTTY